MNFRIRFKILAEFPVLDLLVRLLIPFHCLFVFVICFAIASRQTRLSGFADSFKKKQKDEAKGHNRSAQIAQIYTDL